MLVSLPAAVSAKTLTPDDPSWETLRSGAVVDLALEDDERIFNGSRVIDLSESVGGDLSSLAGFSTGSVVVRFKLDPAHAHETNILVGLANAQAQKPQPNQLPGLDQGYGIIATAQTNQGRKIIRVALQHTAYMNMLDLPEVLSDGEWHTAVVSSGKAKSIRLTVDGKELFASNNSKFQGLFSKMGTVATASIGGLKNVDGTIACGFHGSISNVVMTQKDLSDEQAIAISRTGWSGWQPIRDMFNESDGNSWAFTGGKEAAGNFSQIGGARSFAGQFEEYIRWTKANNRPASMQRYVTNLGREGMKVSDVADSFEKRIRPLDPKAVLYLVGAEDLEGGEAGLEEFKAGLSRLSQSALSLRGNTGLFVIQKPHAVADTEKNAWVSRYAAAVDEFMETAGESSRSRITVVGDPAEGNSSFIQDCLDDAGLLNARGHLELGRKLAQATIGTVDNYPGQNVRLNLKAVDLPVTCLQEAPSAQFSAGLLRVSIPEAVAGKLGEKGWQWQLTSEGRRLEGTAASASFEIGGLWKDKPYELRVRTADGSAQLATIVGTLSEGDTARRYYPKETAATASIAEKLASGKPMTWLFMGDSITHGALWTNGYDSVPQTFAKYLEHDLKRPEDIVINTAVSGSTTVSTLNNIDRRLNAYSPDVVFLMIGTNDCGPGGNSVPLETYRTNLGLIIDKIKAHSPEATIILRSPTGVTQGYGAMEKYSNAMKEVAEERKLAFVDQYTDLQQTLTTYPWTAKGGNLLYGNPLHPGPNGQLICFRKTVEACGLSSGDSILGNLIYQEAITEEKASRKPKLSTGKGSISCSRTTLRELYPAVGEMTLEVSGTDGTRQKLTVDMSTDEAAIAGLKEGRTYWVSLSAYLTTEAKHVSFPAQEVRLGEDFGHGTEGQPFVSGETAGSDHFRIPSLQTLSNGWLLAAGDARWSSNADSPNNLDTVVSLSKDGGVHWEWELVNEFVDFPSANRGYKNLSASFIDPAMVQAGDGTVYLMADAWPAGSGIWGTGGDVCESTGFDEKGNFLLMKGQAGQAASTAASLYSYYADAGDIQKVTVDGVSYSLRPIKDSQGSKTGQAIDASYNLWDLTEEGAAKPSLTQQYESGNPIQNNVMYAQSVWKAYPTCYVWLRTGRIGEKGMEWGEPRILNIKKKDDQPFTGACPGHGLIVPLKDGGERILFQVYESKRGGNELASTIYSDDGGLSWQRGERASQVGGAGKGSESQTILLPDGRVRMYSRNNAGHIFYTDSSDGGIHWGPYQQDDQLAYCGNCMVSFINLKGSLFGPDGSRYDNLVAASYPKGPNRANGVVRIGSVETETGKVSWLNGDEPQYPGKFSYSCLDQVNAGQLGLLAERQLKEDGSDDIVYYPIQLTDLLGAGWHMDKWMELESTSDMLVKGQSLKLNARLMEAEEPMEEAADIHWTVSDQSLASLSAETGSSVSLNGLAAGRVRVTARASGKDGSSYSRSLEIYILENQEEVPADFLAGKIKEEAGGKTVPYLLDGSAEPENGTFVIYNEAVNRIIVTTDGKKGNQSTPRGLSPDKSQLKLDDSAKTNEMTWRLERQDDGRYTIRSLFDSQDRYLTLSGKGQYASLEAAAFPFSLEKTADGSLRFKAELGGNDVYLANLGNNGQGSFWGGADAGQGKTDFHLYRETVFYTIDDAGLTRLLDYLAGRKLAAETYEEAGWKAYSKALKAAQAAHSKAAAFSSQDRAEAQEVQKKVEAARDELFKAYRSLSKLSEQPEPKPELEGWHIVGKEKRYYQKGKALTGLQTIGKTTYLFDKEGDCQYGWHQVNGYACYFTPKDEASLAGGGLQTGLRKVGQTYYLFDSCESEKPGAKLEGWHKLNDHDYYFDPAHQGGMLTGLRKIGQTTYLFDQMASSCPGAKLSGWHRLNGRDYYFNPKAGGGMVTGIFTPDKVTYRFGSYLGRHPGAKLGVVQ